MQSKVTPFINSFVNIQVKTKKKQTKFQIADIISFLRCHVELNTFNKIFLVFRLTVC